MNNFDFVVDLLSKTGAIGNCIIDLEITKRNFNALKCKDDLRVQKQLNISLQRYHNEIDELHRIIGINPPPPNEPIPHNTRNELQYITDRIPAYVALRELKGDLRAYAIDCLLPRLYTKRKIGGYRMFYLTLCLVLGYLFHKGKVEISWNTKLM